MHIQKSAIVKETKELEQDLTNADDSEFVSGSVVTNTGVIYTVNPAPVVPAETGQNKEQGQVVNKAIITDIDDTGCGEPAYMSAIRIEESLVTCLKKA